MPATDEIRIPVADPVSELRLIIITSERKLVFRLKLNANTHSVTSKSDWKNPIITYPITLATTTSNRLVGVSSILRRNGLVGLLLGWGAFPAILVALVLQAVFFQFGGITTLGVNTVVMALPATLCYLIFARFVHQNSRTAVIAAFACGFLSVLLSGLFVALSLIFTDENFLEVSGVIIAAHMPVMIIEGIVTAICVTFLRKVKPEMLLGKLN